MKLRILAAAGVVAIATIGTLPAQARRPLGEFNAGYSFISPSTDFDLTAHGFTLGIAGNATSWFGVAGEADAWFDVGASNADIYSTVAGPRFSIRRRGATVFAQLLAGAAYMRVAGRTHSEFVMKIGGGIDFNFGRHYAWRIEAGDLLFVDPVDHNFTASTGFVYRWY